MNLGNAPPARGPNTTPRASCVPDTRQEQRSKARREAGGADLKARCVLVTGPTAPARHKICDGDTDHRKGPPRREGRLPDHTPLI